MARHHSDSIDAWLEERADQPFGDTELVTGRTLQPFSVAGQQAAANLLTKAARALDEGGRGGARAYVERACRLPFDRYEGMHPAAAEVSMALYRLVSDALESASAGDVRWLEAAHSAAEAGDDTGRTEMAAVLGAVESEYELSRVERTMLRSLLESLPAGPELHDQDVPPDELPDRVLSVLDTCRDYGLALGFAG